MGDYDHILIIADIEGSCGCWSYKGSSFMTDEWSRACVEMTHDLNAVVQALFDVGVRRITVKDFHRTGYNLIPEMIDSRARVVSGYKQRPVLGIGYPGDADALMLIGMHAASGTDGFLAHTLTSRIERLEVNGKLMAEVELFSASLAPYGLRPIFFSGCPIACAQAREAIDGINVYSIDKSVVPDSFYIASIRSGLARAAVESLCNSWTRPYMPEGPFKAVITMKNGGGEAREIACRWGYDYKDEHIFIQTSDILTLYADLVRICYLKPFAERILPLALYLYNLWGHLGLYWLRWRINTMQKGSHSGSKWVLL